MDDNINCIAHSLQLKGNFLANQGLRHVAEISPTKGGKIEPPLKLVLTTHLLP